MPSWPVARRVQVTPLLAPLPAEDPLAVAYRRLRTAIDEIGQISRPARQCAPDHALRLMLAKGYEQLEHIAEDDLVETDWGTTAFVDTIDALLCHLRVFDRTPVRGWSKTRRARHQPTVKELVARKGIPERFAAARADGMPLRISRTPASTRVTRLRTWESWLYLAAPRSPAARSEIFEYIEARYNRTRRHSTPGLPVAADYENSTLSPDSTSLAASRLASLNQDNKN